MKKASETCCEMMAHQLAWKCDQHDSPFDCPDAVITKTKRGYGLIIHDGGSAFLKIAYCPWCATRL